MARKNYTVYSEKKTPFRVLLTLRPPTNVHKTRVPLGKHLLNFFAHYKSKGYDMSRRKKHYGTLHLIFDFFMVFITGGLWLIWILIRFLRSNTN